MNASQLSRRIGSRARRFGARGPLFTLVLVSLALVSLVLACTTTTSSRERAKVDRECQPGAFVFCRCQDRQEGTKLCNDDGNSFGPCEPCESYGNPEGPLEPGDPGFEEPFPEEDGGFEVDGGPRSKGSCGNGKVESGEDCDDQNTNETDGCDSSCKLAGKTPFATNACPGLDVHVWGGGHAPTLESTTAGSGNRSVKPSCTSSANPTSGAGSSDRVFKVTAHKTGNLEVATSDVSYNVFLWASEACQPSENTLIACANQSAGVGPETMTFPVENGKSYYVFVDGAGTDSGTRQGSFRVTFSIP